MSASCSTCCHKADYSRWIWSQEGGNEPTNISPHQFWCRRCVTVAVVTFRGRGALQHDYGMEAELQHFLSCSSPSPSLSHVHASPAHLLYCSNWIRTSGAFIYSCWPEFHCSSCCSWGGAGSGGWGAFTTAVLDPSTTPVSSSTAPSV